MNSADTDRRYIEVALGLLLEPEAIKLLLSTAKVELGAAGPPEQRRGEERRIEQLGAAKTIAKQCGYLPLFLCIVGRLIYEHERDAADGSQGWEHEVVMMLDEDRGRTLGSAGSNIVGRSLRAPGLSGVGI